jgi:putative hemolysin
VKPGLARLAPLALLACVAPEKAPAPGIANPASVYCMKQGGTLEMSEEAGGTVGYCRLPDGTVIEEWAFFRANNP